MNLISRLILKQKKTLKKLAGVSPQELLALCSLTKAPYDPFFIAKKIGLEIDKNKAKEYNFSLTKEFKKTCKNFIQVEERMNFQCAYQIASFVLSKGYNDIKKPEIYAQALLMPTKEMLAYYKKQKENRDNSATNLVQTISKNFKVSKVIALQRLKDLDIVNKKFNL